MSPVSKAGADQKAAEQVHAAAERLRGRTELDKAFLDSTKTSSSDLNLVIRGCFASLRKLGGLILLQSPNRPKTKRKMYGRTNQFQRIYLEPLPSHHLLERLKARHALHNAKLSGFLANLIDLPFKEVIQGPYVGDPRRKNPTLGAQCVKPRQVNQSAHDVSLGG
jgi:hypothetical protein